jgi:hypothetical protein
VCLPPPRKRQYASALKAAFCGTSVTALGGSSFFDAWRAVSSLPYVSSGTSIRTSQPPKGLSPARDAVRQEAWLPNPREFARKKSESWFNFSVNRRPSPAGHKSGVLSREARHPNPIPRPDLRRGNSPRCLPDMFCGKENQKCEAMPLMAARRSFSCVCLCFVYSSCLRFSFSITQVRTLI